MTATISRHIAELAASVNRSRCRQQSNSPMVLPDEDDSEGFSAMG